jgi:Holliday junction resolvase RusA-like endonuclease
MPKKYVDWKEAVAAELLLLGHSDNMIGNTIEGNLKMYTRFGSDFMELQLVKVEHVRAKHVRGDIDNLNGGLMDALQDAEVIVNDAQIVGLESTLWTPEGGSI